MNYAIILAGGSGQRMKQKGMPKQFINAYGKPIIVYTLEVFEQIPTIDKIVIPCNKEWIEHMKELSEKYNITKAQYIISGGSDRTESIKAGLNAIESSLAEEDIVIIHDGVRPLVNMDTIEKNIEVVKKYGNAMTVKANIETVVVTNSETAQWEDFKKRSDTYTLTAPQSFRAKELITLLEEAEKLKDTAEIPLLDMSLMYAKLGKDIHLVVEEGNNLKITTPEDYYYLKSYLELQENKHILGV